MTGIVKFAGAEPIAGLRAGRAVWSCWNISGCRASSCRCVPVRVPWPCSATGLTNGMPYAYPRSTSQKAQPSPPRRAMHTLPRLQVPLEIGLCAWWLHCLSYIQQLLGFNTVLFTESYTNCKTIRTRPALQRAHIQTLMYSARTGHHVHINAVRGSVSLGTLRARLCGTGLVLPVPPPRVPCAHCDAPRSPVWHRLGASRLFCTSSSQSYRSFAAKASPSEAQRKADNASLVDAFMPLDFEAFPGVAGDALRTQRGDHAVFATGPLVILASMVPQFSAGTRAVDRNA